MGVPGQFLCEAQLAVPPSPALSSALERLDALVNWERRRKTGQTGAPGLMRVDCQPIHDLLLRLNSPQKHFKSVHVTGTKGKGSVCALLACALALPPFPPCNSTSVPFASPEPRAPAPIGLYSSPHIERINERIRFDGATIPDSNLAHALNLVLDMRGRDPEVVDSTWFDVITATAMLTFREANVHRAIVEVGMGGRLDSTNVLQAPVSIITNIHMEHANVIGPTLRDIAYEKAGIIAAGASVVVGMSQTDPLAGIFQAEAQKHSSPARIHFCPPLPQEPLMRTNLRIARMGLHLIAQHECLDVDTNAHLSEELAHAALARFPGRQELFTVRETVSEPSVQVLLDGGHVPDSVRVVLREVAGAANGDMWSEPAVVVVAISIDKDITGIARAVAEGGGHVIVTQISENQVHERAETTARAIQEAGPRSMEVIIGAEDALYKALREARKRGTGVVALGSLHLAGKLRPLLRQLCCEELANASKSARK